MALTKITPQMFDTSATAHDLNVDNGTFVVDGSASRVGIGTATPSTLLHVDGTATATTFVGALTGNVTGNVSGTAATVTGAAQTNITSLGTLTVLTVDDITINGSTISDAGDLTFDVGGDIILDAGGNEIKLKTGGTEWGQIYNSSNDLAIYSAVQDKDIKLQGNDGGSVITAMTIDMSAGGSVGIGITSPTARLEVQGAFAYASGANSLATTVSKAAARIKGSSDASTSLFFGSLTNDAEQYIQSANHNGSAADDLALNPYGGKIGIGLNNVPPSATLDIVAPANTIPLQIRATTEAYNYIEYENASGTDIGYIGSGPALVTSGNASDFTIRAQARNLSFAIGNTERARINTDGNLIVNNFLGVRTANRGDGGTPAYSLTMSADNSGNAIEIFRTNNSKLLQYMSTDGKYYFDMYGSATPEIIFRNAGQTWMRTQGSRLFITGNNTQTLGSGSASGTGSNTTNLQVDGAIDMGYQGRYTHGLWGPTTLASNYRYTHLRTSMWGGGSPHGNSEYIMGGFIITGYRYASTANHRSIHQFHNWSGGLHNYTVNNLIDGGGWSGASHVYVDSTGYVTIRLDSQTAAYRMFYVEYIQYSIYNKIDAAVTAITASNSTTI